MRFFSKVSIINSEIRINFPLFYTSLGRILSLTFLTLLIKNIAELCRIRIKLWNYSPTTLQNKLSIRGDRLLVHRVIVGISEPWVQTFGCTPKTKDKRDFCMKIKGAKREFQNQWVQNQSFSKSEGTADPLHLH